MIMLEFDGKSFWVHSAIVTTAATPVRAAVKCPTTTVAIVTTSRATSREGNSKDADDGDDFNDIPNNDC